MHLPSDARSMFLLVPRAREMRREPTPSEERLWAALRGKQLGVRVRRQHVLPPFIADFYVASCKLVIEIDGCVHASEAHRRYDALRTESLVRSYGVRVLRVSADRVMTELDAVLALIRSQVVR